jgi:hypothetical protein
MLQTYGGSGGSGGGAGRNTTNGGGASTATLGLGNRGGYANGLINGTIRSGGAGGGATSVGQDAVGSATRAQGGIGYTSSISGVSVVYATGGAGGVRNTSSNGQNGAANTGNGGWGADGNVSAGLNGGNGGSGIVIVRYPLQLFSSGILDVVRGYRGRLENTDDDPCVHSVVKHIRSVDEHVPRVHKYECGIGSWTVTSPSPGQTI